MEKNNLITRSRDNIDERIVKISLTHKGEELKEKAKSIPLSLISCFPMIHLSQIRRVWNQLLICLILSSIQYSYAINNNI